MVKCGLWHVGCKSPVAQSLTFHIFNIICKTILSVSAKTSGAALSHSRCCLCIGLLQVAIEYKGHDQDTVSKSIYKALSAFQSFQKPQHWDLVAGGRASTPRRPKVIGEWNIVSKKDKVGEVHFPLHVGSRVPVSMWSMPVSC